MKGLKLVLRENHPEDTIIKIGKLEIGKKFVIMAGPCAVESLDQTMTIAKGVKENGADILRGGAFKPRSNPYSFQGMGEEGLKILSKAREETGLPIITEVMDTDDIALVEKYAGIIQIGARNMQNFAMLKKIGKTKKPIMLKRGLSATVEEWLSSAEYIMKEGNHQVMLCERGIRTFSDMTRNTLDLSVVPIIKKLSHLPIIVDPTHATGRDDLVPVMSKAAIVSGADGIMVEVHNNKEGALCDGKQSLTVKDFEIMVKDLQKYIEMENKG